MEEAQTIENDLDEQLENELQAQKELFEEQQSFPEVVEDTSKTGPPLKIRKRLEYEEDGDDPLSSLSQTPSNSQKAHFKAEGFFFFLHLEIPLLIWIVFLVSDESLFRKAKRQKLDVESFQSSLLQKSFLKVTSFSGDQIFLSEKPNRPKSLPFSVSPKVCLTLFFLGCI